MRIAHKLGSLRTTAQPPSDGQELEFEMPKLARAATGVGFPARMSAAGVGVIEREVGRLCSFALALAWFVRLSGRGTLASYRARHRPLAGPAPGARLPQ